MLSSSSDARNCCQPEDVVLCFSAAEPDAEVTAIAARAGELGARTWALTGSAPNAVAAACTEAVCVDAAVTTTVEEVHLAAIHILCAALNSAVRDAVRAGRWSVPAGNAESTERFGVRRLQRAVNNELTCG